MNFNYNDQSEYELYGNLVHEEINLYGLEVRYFKTERVGIDNIFGEHKSIKVDGENVFEFSVKLVQEDGFVNLGDIFGKYGVSSTTSLEMIISAKTMKEIHPDIYEGKGYDGIVGNLIKLPNGKFMEVTAFEDEVEGYNNMFTYAQEKKLFKITVRTYTENRDQLESIDTDTDYEVLDLDSVFNVDETRKQEQDIEAIKETKTVVVDENNDGIAEITERTAKPVVRKSNPFGSLG